PRHRPRPRARGPGRVRPRRRPALLMTQLPAAGIGLLCYCRGGFEPELAAELGERAATAGHHGYAATERGSGFVRFLAPGIDAAALSRDLPLHALVFARQKLLLLAELERIDTSDRITPLLAALQDVGQGAGGAGPAYGALVVEHPDSDDGRPL